MPYSCMLRCSNLGPQPLDIPVFGRALYQLAWICSPRIVDMLCNTCAYSCTWVDGVRPASCYPVMCKAVGVPNHYMCGVVRHSGVWCLLRVLGLERCPSLRPLLTSKDAIGPTTHLFLGAGLLNRADTGTPRSGPLDLTHEPNYHRYTLRYTTLYSACAIYTDT